MLNVELKKRSFDPSALRQAQGPQAQGPQGKQIIDWSIDTGVKNKKRAKKRPVRDRSF
jgi:hypothetical protein